MKIYNKSINYLMKQNPKIKRSEWNKIAKEKNLLSARTIEYYAGMSIRQLILNIRNKY